MTKPKAVKVGQVYRCRDERHGKRMIRVIAIGRYRAGVSARRGNSRKWVKSDRTIKLSRFNDDKKDYKLVEPK